MSLMDEIVGGLVPGYSQIGIIFNLGIVLMFVLLAKTVSKDWRVLVLAGILGFLFAFGYVTF